MRPKKFALLCFLLIVLLLKGFTQSVLAQETSFLYENSDNGFNITLPLNWRVSTFDTGYLFSSPDKQYAGSALSQGSVIDLTIFPNQTGESLEMWADKRYSKFEYKIFPLNEGIEDPNQLIVYDTSGSPLLTVVSGNGRYYYFTCNSVDDLFCETFFNRFNQNFNLSTAASKQAPEIMTATLMLQVQNKIKFPFKSGLPWKVIQGYNIGSHNGYQSLSLDLQRDSSNPEQDTVNEKALSPVSGDIAWGGYPTEKDGCISLKTDIAELGGAGVVRTMVCHVVFKEDFRLKDPLAQGQNLGNYANVGEVGFENTPHSHVTLYEITNGDEDDRKALSFDGFGGIDGYNFANNKFPDEWFGTVIYSTNQEPVSPPPPPPPVSGAVDTALIIDSSGSMSWNDPENLRLRAARAYLLASMRKEGGDYIGIVDFDSTTRIASPLLRIPEGKDALFNAINTIDSSGGTNVGAGIQTACDVLASSPSGNAKKAAILLTDGQGNFASEDECFKAEGRNWPIYTFALGSADDALLQQIASNTGGEFKRLSTKGLVCEFQSVRAKIGGVEPQPCTSTGISSGGVVNFVRNILSNMAQATFSIVWGGSDVIMTLKSPSGRLIDRDTVAPDVIHDLDSNYEIYTILDPEPGDWEVSLFGADVPPGGEEVIFGMTMLPKVDQLEVVINDDDEYTNEKGVKVSLNYPDNTEKIRLSNLPFREKSIIPGWEKPKNELEWNLMGVPGEAIVYAQFKYDDNSLSEIFTDSIIYDGIRPLGRVVINNGTSPTNSVNVKVKIPAVENGSGLHQMKVSNSQNLDDVKWQPYQEEFDWQLEELGDGRPQTRRVYVRLKDKAGNISPILPGIILLKPS